MEKNPIVFGGKYVSQQLISGKDTPVFSGIDKETNKEVAIKIEYSGLKHHRYLYYEYWVYKQLHADSSTIDSGIPKVYYFGEEADKNDDGAIYRDFHIAMVMDRLGPSLDDLFKKCEFLKTVLMLAEQMLSRMEFVHEKKFLHRDVKPGNFVMGFGTNAHKVYLIDFGISEEYIEEDGSHRSYRECYEPRGNVFFCSINTDLGITTSRRDDLESLAYLFIYFLKGGLPWENLKYRGYRDFREKIMEKKLSLAVEKLCEELPLEFLTFLRYTRNLTYYQTPDYLCEETFS